MLRGQIWLANLKDMGGSIQNRTRPVLIVSNNLANLHSPVIHICPISSKTLKRNFPTHVLVGKDSGLLTESIILVEQSMLVSKEFLSIQVGKCSDIILNKVNSALALQFGLINQRDIKRNDSLYV